jgi:4-amino-4-deoxy-L-arabinose transferase-like glycosyltransferase
LRRGGWWLCGGLVGWLVAAHDGPALPGWVAYPLLGAAAGLGFSFVWRSIVGHRRQRSLLLAVAAALALRLAVGFAWGALLPQFGNDEAHHNAGVFFPDAFVRDRSGWSIGRTEGASLLDAFDSAKGDQYGTLLFLSAATYRAFGPQVQSTLLPAALAAACGALAVLLTWGFTSRFFGQGAAALAAWVVALYPDAVLLGAETMREPFVMAGLAAALYGYALARAEPLRRGIAWLVGGVLLCLAISPPFAVVCILVVGTAALWEGRGAGRSAGWVLAALVGFGVLAGLLTLRAWAGIEGSPEAGQGVLAWWLDGVRYQMDRLETASGWVQTIFGQTPAWSHLPLATAYGILQPFLPAAVTDNTGQPLMSAVMILRAVGWFAVLPVLLVAPALAVRREGWRSLSFFLVFVFLLATVLVSYRFAGDQWDSPRYRTALLPVVAAVIGWSWRSLPAQARRSLIWAYGLLGLETVIVGWWYAGRYHRIPRLNFYGTLALAVAAGVVYAGLAARAELRRRRGGRGLPGV